MGLFIKGKAMIGGDHLFIDYSMAGGGWPSIINPDLTWPGESHFSKIILSIHSKNFFNHPAEH